MTEYNAAREEKVTILYIEFYLRNFHFRAEPLVRERIILLGEAIDVMES